MLTELALFNPYPDFFYCICPLASSIRSAENYGKNFARLCVSLIDLLLYDAWYRLLTRREKVRLQLPRTDSATCCAAEKTS